LAGVPDTVDDGQVPGAILPVEFLAVKNLHHWLQAGVQLGEAVA